MDQSSGLSARRTRFVDEYLVDLNATQAAIRAGYSSRAAKVTGSRLLTNDNVAAAITVRKKRLSTKLGITAERVLNELGRIAFANVADFYFEGEGGVTKLDSAALLDRERAAAVSQMDVTVNAKGETTTRVKLADKRAALVDLGRHLGLFTEVAEPVAPRDQRKPIDDRELALATIAMLREAYYRAETEGRSLPRVIEAV